MPGAIATGIVAAPGAAVASVMSPVFIPGVVGTIAVSKLAARVVNEKTFQCQHTFGCWMPHQGLRTWPFANKDGKNCRMPEPVKLGVSPLWFLPPPGVMLVRVARQAKAGAYECKMAPCTNELMRESAVGFAADVSQAKNKSKFVKLNIRQSLSKMTKTDDSLPNVLNCQQLPFEDMSATQRGKFLKLVKASGLDREYDLAQIEPMLRSGLQAEARSAELWRELKLYDLSALQGNSTLLLKATEMYGETAVSTFVSTPYEFGLVMVNHALMM